MPRDGVVMRGRNETSRAIIEGQIFGFDRQEIYHRFDHATFQKTRNAIVSARHAMAEIHWVSGKDFIATGTSETRRIRTESANNSRNRAAASLMVGTGS